MMSSLTAPIATFVADGMPPPRIGGGRWVHLGNVLLGDLLGLVRDPALQRHP